jgi:hypothetical protein
MKVQVKIRTDSLNLTAQTVEARSSLEAVLLALHHETSAYQHLKDLRFAHISIQASPVSEAVTTPRTLNQEVNGV